MLCSIAGPCVSLVQVAGRLAWQAPWWAPRQRLERLALPFLVRSQAVVNPLRIQARRDSRRKEVSADRIIAHQEAGFSHSAYRREIATMGGSVVVPLGKVNIAEKFALFDEYWSPKIIGEINDSYVKAVKVKGEFVWHHHEHEDEMFLVVRGSLRMQFRDREIQLGEGEFIIVPRGIEHRPVADEETHILLFEPKTTLNTGNVRNERTREQLERL